MPKHRGRVQENACGSKEVERPLSRFPLRGKAGAGGFPPRRRARCAASKKRWHASCAGSPHKRAAAPLCIPCERGAWGLQSYETVRESQASTSRSENTGFNLRSRLHKILDTTPAGIPRNSAVESQ